LRTGTANLKLVMLESRHYIAKACAYSRHQCLDNELGELSELGKDILINDLIDDLILIQITFLK